MFRFYPFLLVFAFFAGCSSTEKAPPMPAVDVTDFVVESKTIPATFDFVGFAESSHPVEIRARVEGYLDTIAYAEGQEVQENDLLFQLDPKQFIAKVEEAKGEVARQQAVLANAILTVNRLTPLYQQKAASKKDLDNATSNKLAAEASLQSAQAQLLNAEINLGYTTIRSPLKGYANRSNFRQGALITPGINGLLTTVSVLDPIWVYFTISDNDILRTREQEVAQRLVLPPGAGSIVIAQENSFDVEAIMSDDTIFPYKGKVDFSSPTYDQKTGTLLARAVFPNPNADLRPGQFVRVKVYGATRPDALFVPRRALMQRKNGMYLYLIDPENKVIAQDVSTGEWYGEFQIITNGLKPGDRVLVDGINKVRPGMKVKVVSSWQPLVTTKKMGTK